jgi:hypothetical protein
VVIPVEYYDAILTGMAISIIAGVSLGLFTSLPLNLTVGGGAVVAAGFMYHGMFENAPISARDPAL